MTTATWVGDVAWGTTDRPPGSHNFHVMCQRCGAIWLTVTQPDARWWICTHHDCVQCSPTASLAGLDWSPRPYAPFRLPRAALLRELDIAISNPTAYNP